MKNRFFTEDELFNIFFEDWSKEYRTFKSYLKSVINILQDLCDSTTLGSKKYIVDNLGCEIVKRGECNKITCEGVLLLKVLIESYCNKTLKLMDEGKFNVEQGRQWVDNEVYDILYNIEERWDEICGNKDYKAWNNVTLNIFEICTKIYLMMLTPKYKTSRRISERILDINADFVSLPIKYRDILAPKLDKYLSKLEDEIKYTIEVSMKLNIKEKGDSSEKIHYLIKRSNRGKKKQS